MLCWCCCLVTQYCDFLWSYGLQHASLPCPSLCPGVCSNSCLLSRWLPPNISPSVTLFSSCCQPFPELGSFPMSWFFTSSGQIMGASTSALVLAMNIQGLIPLGLTFFISLLSMGLSRVFSNTTIPKHQVFGTQPSLWSNSHIWHDYWKSHSFDFMDLCQQSDVCAF